MPSRIARASLIVALATLALTGCVDAGTPTPTPTAVQPTPSLPPEDPEPVIDLEGTAEDNLEHFDTVNNALIAAGGTLDGRAFIDNLVAAGFPKSDMEVTADRTAINLAADNVQFSVRLNGTCLLGQYGNVGYVSATSALLSTGRCLVGATRPIDW